MFCVQKDARDRVKTQIGQLELPKDDVGSLEYNAAVMLIKQINRIPEQQLFENSTDGMVGLGSEHTNMLTAYKSNISIKKAMSSSNPSP